jgi:hypothetical protein
VQWCDSGGWGGGGRDDTRCIGWAGAEKCREAGEEGGNNSNEGPVDVGTQDRREAWLGGELQQRLQACPYGAGRQEIARAALHCTLLKEGARL